RRQDDDQDREEHCGVALRSHLGFRGECGAWRSEHEVAGCNPNKSGQSVVSACLAAGRVVHSDRTIHRDCPTVRLPFCTPEGTNQ
ncbi:hypothetical protein RCL06_24610, partial [Salmonella enterica subsp. enterica serovar Typhimurium]